MLQQSPNCDPAHVYPASPPQMPSGEMLLSLLAEGVAVRVVAVIEEGATVDVEDTIVSQSPKSLSQYVTQ